MIRVNAQMEEKNFCGYSFFYSGMHKFYSYVAKEVNKQVQQKKEFKS